MDDFGTHEFRTLALKQEDELVAFATIGWAKNAPTSKAMVELLYLARKGDRGDAHKETGRCLLQALMAACSRQKVLVSDGFIVAAPSEKLVGW